MHISKTVHKLLALLAVAALAVSLAACGDGTQQAGDTAGDNPTAAGNTAADSAAEPAPTTASEGDIVMWLFAETHSNYFNWATEQYAAGNEGVGFSIEVMTGDALHERLAVVITAGGEGTPDLVDVEQGQFPRYMNANMMCFEPLNSYIDRDGVGEKMVEARLSLYAYNGNYYGLEHALCPVTMAYRPDMFEEYGITVPTTWDEYKQAAAQFAEHGIYIAANADMRMRDASDEISILLRGAGRDIADANGNLDLNDTWRQLVTDFRDMQNNGQMFPAEIDEDMWVQFRDDKVATYLTADWAAGWLRDNVPEQSGLWAMTYMPKLTADSSRTSCRGGTGLTMMEGTDKDKELLWDFMKFAMVDTDNNVKKYEMINLYPPVYDAMPLCNSPVEYYGGQVLGELYQELAPEMPVQNQASWRSRYGESFKTNAYDFCEGNLTVDEFAEILTADVDAYLAEQGL